MKSLFKSRIFLWSIGLLLAALIGVAVYFLVPGLQGVPAAPEPETWPTSAWQITTPEEQGIDSALLAKGIKSIRENNIPIHSLLIIRDGKIVMDAYFYPFDGSLIHNAASITKSLTTTLIGIAADRGLLKLDDSLVSFFPEYKIANPDPRRDRITLRHLASMSGGIQCSGLPAELTVRDMEATPDWVQFGLNLPMADEPGKTWNYCGVGMHLLSAVLTKVTGKPALEFARTNLFEPLGIQDVAWVADPQGINLGAGNIRMHPTDLAKLGLLWLHEGEWNGKQIVSRKWVQASIQPYHPAGNDFYGYGWWLSKNGSHTVVNAKGVGGQQIAIERYWNMIVVATGGGYEFNEVLPYILPAILDTEHALPANPAGVSQLREAVAAIAQPPVPQPAAVLPDLANQVSGKTYRFEANLALIQTVRLDFNDRSQARIQIGFSDGRLIPPAAVGLDRVFRMTPGLDLDRSSHPFVDFQNLQVGLRGSWIDPKTFLLDYDTIADRFDYQIKMQFAEDRLFLSVSERGTASGLNIMGRQQSD